MVATHLLYLHGFRSSPKSPMAQSVASGTHWAGGALMLKGNDGNYDKYVRFSDLYIESVKPIPPTRPGEPTLVEYTLSYTSLLFSSPSNPGQTNTSSCLNSNPHPVFSITRGLPIDLGSMFGTVYSISSYSHTVTMWRGAQTEPSFSMVSVSGPLGNDGPCFMSFLTYNKPYSIVTIYTATQSTPTNILLESRIKMADVLTKSYRLYTNPSGVIQQEMSFKPTQIYWGYYPINPDSGANDPIIEKGWNITTNTAL